MEGIVKTQDEADLGALAEGDHFVKDIHGKLLGASAALKTDYDAALQDVIEDPTSPGKLSTLQMASGSYTSSLGITASIVKSILDANQQIGNKF